VEVIEVLQRVSWNESRASGSLFEDIPCINIQERVSNRKWVARHALSSSRETTFLGGCTKFVFVDLKHRAVLKFWEGE